MPTGFTAGVADGTVTDFKTFALQLARGMGALATMRDEPWDAPIPDSLEPSKYHMEALSKLRTEYRRVLNLTEQQCEVEVQKLTQEYYDAKAKAREEHDARKERYEDMIEHARNWTGAPEGIREFALKQLRTGRDFDCREPFKYYGKLPDADPEKWREAELGRLDREIMYHSGEYEKEVMRTSQRNAWIKKLKESLND
mgnify:FL=1|tara:strand:+ start:4105 stop:4698 length:594 start_codon:yes stop_codon:yes gene_type:complete